MRLSIVVGPCASILNTSAATKYQGALQQLQYLLKRDLDPASNDNSPVVLNAAAITFREADKVAGAKRALGNALKGCFSAEASDNR